MSESEPGNAVPGDLKALGARLREARNAINVAQREVADALNLPISVIEAIETGDTSELPAPVFARGYIRSYAKLLEIDVDDALGPVEETPVPTSESPIVLLGDRPPSVFTRHPGWLFSIAVGVVVLLVLIILLFVWPDSSEPDAPGTPNAPATGAPLGAASLPTVGEPEIAEAAAEASSPELSQVVDSSAAQPVATVPAAEPLPRPEPPVESVTLPPASEVVALAPPATPAGMRRITAAGEDQLVVRFAQDCWIEVKAADGRLLFSDLRRGDSTLGLIGAGPFRVLLGYAPGASVTFNGETVPLAPHTRDNVATLMVGQ